MRGLFLLHVQRSEPARLKARLVDAVAVHHPRVVFELVERLLTDGAVLMTRMRTVECARTHLAVGDPAEGAEKGAVREAEVQVAYGKAAHAPDAPWHGEVGEAENERGK